MTKEQQIEEMTKLIQAKEIRPCDDDVHCENCYCACKGMAEMIYNAGYRKVPKYAVILSHEERDKETKAYNEERKERENELLTIQMTCLSAYFEVEQLQKENKQLQEQLNSANAGNVNCSGCGLVEINAVKEFAKKVKGQFILLEQRYIAMLDGKAHSAVFECESKIDELLKEYEK